MLNKLCLERPVTTDEELNLLDSQLRRLKIEYEIYFSNPTKRPPTDIEWKVLSLLRKFSDGGRMSFSQRYRYNEMAQRYAIYSDLWRKKTGSAKKAIAVLRMRFFPFREFAPRGRAQAAASSGLRSESRGRCRSSRRRTCHSATIHPSKR